MMEISITQGEDCRDGNVKGEGRRWREEAGLLSLGMGRGAERETRTGRHGVKIVASVWVGAKDAGLARSSQRLSATLTLARTVAHLRPFIVITQNAKTGIESPTFPPIS